MRTRVESSRSRELERFPSKNLRDAKGRISETGRSHTCSNQSVSIEDARRKRKVAKREGHETSKTNDSTWARIVIKRVSQRKEEKGRKHTKR